MFDHPRNRIVMLCAVLGAVSTLVVVAPAASAQLSCFGHAATIAAQPGEVTYGTSGPDVIVGTSGPDIVRGRGGDDLICTGAGNDRVFGGGGADAISLGDDADTANGGRGTDYIEGGDGSDSIRGNRGRDVINAGTGTDRCWGGKGSDSLTSCNEVPPTRSASSSSMSTGELEMSGLVNDLRASYGRSGLSVSADLSAVARSWSRNLTSEFRHNPNVGAQIPDGARAWGENIAINTSVSAAFAALVASDGHFANMTDTGFTHVGVGVHVANGRVYVTQVFATYS